MATFYLVTSTATAPAVGGGFGSAGFSGGMSGGGDDKQRLTKAEALRVSSVCSSAAAHGFAPTNIRCSTRVVNLQAASTVRNICDERHITATLTPDPRLDEDPTVLFSSLLTELLSDSKVTLSPKRNSDGASAASAVSSFDVHERICLVADLPYLRRCAALLLSLDHSPLFSATDLSFGADVIIEIAVIATQSQLPSVTPVPTLPPVPTTGLETKSNTAATASTAAPPPAAASLTNANANTGPTLSYAPPGITYCVRHTQSFSASGSMQVLTVLLVAAELVLGPPPALSLADSQETAAPPPPPAADTTIAAAAAVTAPLESDTPIPATAPPAAPAGKRPAPPAGGSATARRPSRSRQQSGEIAYATVAAPEKQSRAITPSAGHTQRSFKTGLLTVAIASTPRSLSPAVSGRTVVIPTATAAPPQNPAVLHTALKSPVTTQAPPPVTDRVIEPNSKAHLLEVEAVARRNGYLPQFSGSRSVFFAHSPAGRATCDLISSLPTPIIFTPQYVDIRPATLSSPRNAIKTLALPPVSLPVVDQLFAAAVIGAPRGIIGSPRPAVHVGTLTFTQPYFPRGGCVTVVFADRRTCAELLSVLVPDAAPAPLTSGGAESAAAGTQAMLDILTAHNDLVLIRHYRHSSGVSISARDRAHQSRIISGRSGGVSGGASAAAEGFKITRSSSGGVTIDATPPASAGVILSRPPTGAAPQPPQSFAAAEDTDLLTDLDPTLLASAADTRDIQNPGVSAGRRAAPPNADGSKSVADSLATPDGAAAVDATSQFRSVPASPSLYTPHRMKAVGKAPAAPITELARFALLKLKQQADSENSASPQSGGGVAASTLVDARQPPFSRSQSAYKR